VQLVLDHFRQPCFEAIIETWQGVRREVLELADVDQGLNDGLVGPDARTPQVGHAQNVDVFVAHGLEGRLYNGRPAVALTISSMCDRCLGIVVKVVATSKIVFMSRLAKRRVGHPAVHFS